MEKEFIEVYNILSRCSSLTESRYYRLKAKYDSKIIDSVIECLIEEDEENFLKFELYYAKLIRELERNTDMSNFDIYLADVSLRPNFDAEKNIELLTKLNCNDVPGKKTKWLVSKVEYCLNNCDDLTILNRIKELYTKFKYYRDLIVEGNLRLVIMLAGDYKECKVSFEDVIQCGNIGLMRAIEKFDLSVGTTFGTYAGYWIKQSINKHVRTETYPVKIPLNVIYDNYHIFDIKNDLSIQYGREVTLEEVANYTNISVEKVETMIPFFMGTWSLNEPLDSRYGDVEYTRQDFLVDDGVDVYKSGVNSTYRIYLSDYLSEILTERELLVLRLYIGIDGIDYTIPEISEIIGVSKQRVSQLQKKALAKIRKRSNFRDVIMD